MGLPCRLTPLAVSHVTPLLRRTASLEIISTLAHQCGYPLHKLSNTGVETGDRLLRACLGQPLCAQFPFSPLVTTVNRLAGRGEGEMLTKVHWTRHEPRLKESVLFQAVGQRWRSG